MAKFANDKVTMEEEPKPPFKILVSFTGYQHLDLIAHNINDLEKQMSDFAERLKCMGLEIEYDDPTYDWINGQSPPDDFFDESKEAPNKLQKDNTLTDGKTQVIVTVNKTMDIETVKEEISHGLGGSDSYTYDIESLDEWLRAFECEGGFGG